jgi:hypothetical protein
MISMHKLLGLSQQRVFAAKSVCPAWAGGFSGNQPNSQCPESADYLNIALCCLALGAASGDWSESSMGEMDLPQLIGADQNGSFRRFMEYTDNGIWLKAFGFMEKRVVWFGLLCALG